MSVPDFLAKHGIRRVEDNIPSGHQLRVGTSVFFLLFKDELMSACTVSSEAAAPVQAPIAVEPDPDELELLAAMETIARIQKKRREGR
ncbi:hypothetical protein [endosymbiont of Riftia pachyptila]|uniref:Uncharacterized protein n=1 Tax=endosymbiont of Riftia pachyptila (vent Ph05) TaxID=1048808 RepID=G2DH82_9GAMM|nr:hypothetical protein [endosymbiont of Riftia pachyptila]EGV50028.1 hypothetical protein Rifp1Sym_el00110 [endosymbiont of Riftia pachyptila (vent Ph05)]